jgi:predicted  nucleic acid-binding Zn-ribbon protein
MADTPTKDSPAKMSQREAQEALEKQVGQLKREISKINKALAERINEEAEQASGWMSGATDRASRATQALRSQAQSVSESVKDNPGTVSSAMLLGGVIGFVLGWTLGQSTEDRRGRWY